MAVGTYCISPNAPSGMMIIHDGFGERIETGMKIPKNQCNSCGRADWVDEVISLEEAIERGYVEVLS